ncbi:DUF1418 family protein [Mixta gaviniae]|uniref:DUF1418 domain-containing protein n=1 Tax=Mixta gaviniae TaxID=665914 RepID=A0A1X1DP07_9GAMM|nr:DUF1418 family protein [Mixta gaviniae]AUX92923.1 DUF1418 domain-containing protein [Mixta gaviniae]ORM78395.1 hypothetical protein HA44_13045 [Mixta gaviniae]
MKHALQLPKTVLALEAAGILLLILAFLLAQQWLALPAGWSGRRIATALLFTGIVLMLPAAVALMWRTAQAIAPELFGRRRGDASSNTSGDSHDADH